MKISYRWLKQCIELDATPQEVAESLTHSGLEIGRITPFLLIPKGVLVGRVLTCAPHPDASRLNVATVDVGAAEPSTIVCGAPNLAVNQKVAVALPGTQLTLGGKQLTIGKRTLRGVTSCGMICSAEELGLCKAQDEGGILVLDEQLKEGTPLHWALGIKEDQILELDLTPNRGDATSHWGVARELAAVTGAELQRPLSKPLIPAETKNIHITVRDADACPRYSGIVLDNLEVKPSPFWLQNRLRAIGQKPVNNIVDITNYVMFELGQPLHAFDYTQVEGGKIIVQNLSYNTPFVGLDGVEYKLSGEELMICDTQGPLGIAGVLGGLRSSITPQTHTIFLESAYFKPELIARAARTHKLHTEAAYRFERGTDPDMVYLALQRAVSLLQELAGGSIASTMVDFYPIAFEDKRVPVTYRYLQRLIGHELPKETIQETLARVEIATKEQTDEGFVALVPPYRSDVNRPADIAEELLRIYGYDKVPLLPSLSGTYPAVTRAQKQAGDRAALSEWLVGLGYHEARHNALTSSHYTTRFPGFLPAQAAPVQLYNPLSRNLDILRPTLLFGGMESVARNLNYGHDAVALFELGTVYWQDEHGTHEEQRLALWRAGSEATPTWHAPTRPASLASLYGSVTTLLARIGAPPTLSKERPERPYFDASLTLELGGQQLVLGSIAPPLLKEWGLKQPLYYTEVALSDLSAATLGTSRKFVAHSAYPAVQRDLSLQVDEKIEYSALTAAVQELQIDSLQRIYLVDYYTGPKVPKGSKSYTLRFVFQSTEQTFKERQIKAFVDKITTQLTDRFGVKIRGEA